MTPPKPSFVEATETSITIHTDAKSGNYAVQWKQHPEDWSRAAQKTLSSSKIVLESCEPGTTYCIRLIDSVSNEMGPELIVDTEQVGCTPQQKSCGCTIS